MADFSHIEQQYLANRNHKANRDAYKIVLISRISQDRSDVCRACTNFKDGFSPAGLWQSFIAGSSSSSAFVNRLINIIKVYPYISLYAGKRLLKLGKSGPTPKILSIILGVVVGKVLYNRFKGDRPESTD